MTKSLLCLWASNFVRSPSDCFLNASMRAVRSGDVGVPGASRGVELSAAAEAAADLSDAANQAPTEAEPKRRTASRRVIPRGRRFAQVVWFFCMVLPLCQPTEP